MAAVTICSDFGVIFWGAPKSLQVVTAAMNLKDRYYSSTKAKERRTISYMTIEQNSSIKYDHVAFIIG